jgi:hypothetical protein
VRISSVGPGKAKSCRSPEVQLMCGSVVQAKDPNFYTRVLGGEPERPVPNTPPHYHGAPGQDYLVGRLYPETGERSTDMLRWTSSCLGPWTARSPGA